MFASLPYESKAVYKSKDICPRELKLKKKNLVLSSTDFQLLEKIDFLGAQGSDQLIF